MTRDGDRNLSSDSWFSRAVKWRQSAATGSDREAYTSVGPDADTKIADAKAVATKPFTDFATWAAKNMPSSE